MAVVIPIVSEWNPKGVDKSLADIQKAEGGWAKAGVGVKKAFLPAVGVLAGFGAVAAKGIEYAQGYAVANKKLGQVLKNQGFEQAHERLTAYADAQEQLIGVESEQVQQVQTQLATFSALTKSVDEAGGAFDRATIAAFDLASAGFGSAEGNATQLGKALQDPIKGMTALAKSGVSFTKAEKDRIKALVESNKLGEAQALILEAVENQVGGTAAASVTSTDKMMRAWESLIFTIGEALLPIFEKVTEFLGRIAQYAEENADKILIFGVVVGGFAAAIVAANIAMKVYEGLTAAIKLATAAWSGVQWVLNAALNANPIGLVVIAITALIAIVVLAYTKCDWFRAIVDKAWEGIRTATEVVFGAVKKIIEVVWEWIAKAFQLTPIGVLITHWDTLKEATVGVWNAIWNVIETIVGKITGAIEAVVGKVRDAANAIKDFAKNIPFIGGLFGMEGPQLSSSSSYLLNASSSGVAAANSGGITLNINTGLGDPIAIARAVEATLRTRNVRLGV